MFEVDYRCGNSYGFMRKNSFIEAIEWIETHSIYYQFIDAYFIRHSDNKDFEVYFEYVRAPVPVP